jgi:hypothetical protein
MIPEVNPLASRISELAKEIGVVESSSPPQPRWYDHFSVFISFFFILFM